MKQRSPIELTGYSAEASTPGSVHVESGGNPDDGCADISKSLDKDRRIEERRKHCAKRPDHVALYRMNMVLSILPRLRTQLNRGKPTQFCISCVIKRGNEGLIYANSFAMPF